MHLPQASRLPASTSTIRRKRSALYSAVRFAVELGHLDSNPLDYVAWRAPATTETVDRRVVVNPATARALLSAVREIATPVEGYFACLYFAGLRPAEASKSWTAGTFLCQPRQNGCPAGSA